MADGEQVGNGIIDEYTQVPYYPEFAVNNTYGIKAYNDTIYQYAQIALHMPSGCLDLVSAVLEVQGGSEAYEKATG